MRIVFNLYDVGLGNNGGSRTLIKCAENLSLIGHDVVLFTNVPNRYTWSGITGPELIVGNKHPKGDVVIATGYKSVKNTLKSSIQKKFYYIRGYETWVTKSVNLMRSYKSLRCIVNSEWLSRFLRKKGVYSDLVYPGLDDSFWDKGKERENVFGAIHHKKHKTKRHDDAFGVSKLSKYPVLMLNKDIKSPSERKLNRWYNRMKVWMSPSELEGLHNPPMEAGMAGCALVCTDHKKSGTSDYAIHGETALVYSARDLAQAAKCVKSLMVDDALRDRLSSGLQGLLKSKIGTRKENMERMAFILSR